MVSSPAYGVTSVGIDGKISPPVVDGGDDDGTVMDGVVVRVVVVVADVVVGVDAVVLVLEDGGTMFAITGPNTEARSFPEPVAAATILPSIYTSMVTVPGTPGNTSAVAAKYNSLYLLHLTLWGRVTVPPSGLPLESV